MLQLCTVKTPNYGSKLGNRCSNLYRCDGRDPPVTLSQVRASNSNFRPVVGPFDCCASAHPGAMVVPVEEQKRRVPAPWNEMCRRNGFLKHERRSFGIWGPGCLQNILNFVCTQHFSYETPVELILQQFDGEISIS